MRNTDEPIDQKESCTLVGGFLQAWAAMEAQLNSVIGTILEIGSPQAYIICKNIQFRDKIHIARTAVSISPLSEDQKTAYDKELKQLAEFTIDRNMVAHDLFMPSEDQMGVEFLVTRAKGKLEFPEVVWSRKDFGDRVEKAMAFRQMLKGLDSDAKERIKLLPLARALASPMPWLLGQGHLVDPVPPHGDTPHSDTDPANSKKDNEIPPSS